MKSVDVVLCRDCVWWVAPGFRGDRGECGRICHDTAPGVAALTDPGGLLVPGDFFCAYGEQVVVHKDE